MHFKEVADLKIKAEIQKIKNEIEKFVEWIFQHHEDSSRSGSKVIHDGVWGTHRYEEFEIALINTPLIQRLRQIHQTAFTFLTYPSTQHTRFEHTLGVTAQIGNLYKALKDKFEYTPHYQTKKHLLGDGLYRTIRMAAILHDCGHGPLSHTSEEIYGKYEEIKLLKRYDPFKDAGPGEILSYLIIDSDYFKDFLSKIKDKYEIDIDDDLIKNAIVGHAPNPLDSYKIDMLHGPFDADKLDYIFRDGHFSGLPLQIDLDRFWYSLDINTVSKRINDTNVKFKHLTIDWGGISSLEQILFSKMTLYPAVYHHHKVRACDCMFKGIIEYVKDTGRKLTKDGLEIDFGRASQFLYFTDPEIFGMHGLVKKDESLHRLMHNLQFRRLLKRTIVISRDTVKEKENLDEYTKNTEKPIFKDGLEYYRWLAKRIWEKAGNPGLFQEIWVDCPKDPSFGEANNTWISPLGEGHEPLPFTEFFEIEKYANQYKLKKWRSHVFCRPEHIDKVSKACVSVFKEEFGIEFKPLAFYLCHVDFPS